MLRYATQQHRLVNCVNSSYTKAIFVKDLITIKPCRVGIHWIALAEYSQTSTHTHGFQSFFSFFRKIQRLFNKSPNIIVHEPSPDFFGKTC